MNFKALFCDPFKPDIIDMGTIEKGKIMETFENIPWIELINKMESLNQSNIYYSPSLEIENKDNMNSLSVSAVDGKEWYIFFKRPKKMKSFFGLSAKVDNNYMTDVTGQSMDDVRKCLEALIKNDLNFLEQKIK